MYIQPETQNIRLQRKMSTFKKLSCVMMILLLCWNLVHSQRCTGYNLEGCECEDDYMVCSWVSFHNILPSLNSVNTRVIFITRSGSLLDENRRYDLAAWPNLEFVSTITQKYSCKDGECTEMIQFSKTSTSILTVVEQITITPETNHKTVPNVNSEVTTQFEQLTHFFAPTTETQLSTDGVKDKKINTSPSNIVQTTINQHSFSSKTTTSDSTNTESVINISTQQTEMFMISSSITNLNMTFIKTNHSTLTDADKFPLKNRWKIAFISGVIIMSVVIMILVIILVYYRKQTKNRGYNRIFRSNKSTIEQICDWEDSEL